MSTPIVNIDNMTIDELLQRGMETLSVTLGIVGAERFIMAIQTEPFDYTQWKQEHSTDEPVEVCHQQILDRCQNNPIPKELDILPEK
ncbi:MAG: hypothetical protein IJF84_05250 [Thermoguttaceae bacterium]|nr:hypothetical protein [Thermoguttaceae bacterium]